MINSIKTFAKIGTGVAAAMILAQAASATTYTFDTTAGATNGTVTAKTYTGTSTTPGASTLNVRVTGWHATDIAGDTDHDSISAASVGLYTPGLGVLAAGESASSNEHQIDNIGGVDFLMLQFNQKVSLSSITRYLFGITGVSPSDSDAAYWADTGNLLGGTASNWNSTINLAGNQISEKLWTTVAGDASQGVKTGVTTTDSAYVWLLGADFNAKRNDGFKLSQFTADTATGAVPEPASWAMMITGFGMVGASMRRRRAALQTA